MDVLKLDRSLVEGVVESARLHKITAGLLRIAGDLGMQSVADGVDLPEQVIALRAMGCTHGQGMAFSGPLDEHRLRRALVRGVYPLPGAALQPVLTGTALTSGVLPGTALTSTALSLRQPRLVASDRVPRPSDRVPLPSSRSNNETPVPPT